MYRSFIISGGTVSCFFFYLSLMFGLTVGIEDGVVYHLRIVCVCVLVWDSVYESVCVCVLEFHVRSVFSFLTFHSVTRSCTALRCMKINNVSCLQSPQSRSIRKHPISNLVAFDRLIKQNENIQTSDNTTTRQTPPSTARGLQTIHPRTGHTVLCLTQTSTG